MYNPDPRLLALLSQSSTAISARNIQRRLKSACRRRAELQAELKTLYTKIDTLQAQSRALELQLFEEQGAVKNLNNKSTAPKTSSTVSKSVETFIEGLSKTERLKLVASLLNGK